MSSVIPTNKDLSGSVRAVIESLCDTLPEAELIDIFEHYRASLNLHARVNDAIESLEQLKKDIRLRREEIMRIKKKNKQVDAKGEPVDINVNQ